MSESKKFLQVLQIVFAIFVVIFSYFIDDIYNSSFFFYWMYFIIVGIELIIYKRITLIFLFLLAFIYIVFSESLTSSQELNSDWPHEDVIKGFRFLITSSMSIFLGYKLNSFLNKRNIFKKKDYIYLIKKKKSLFLILIIADLLFFLINFQNTIYGLFSGRSSAFPFGFISYVMYSIIFIIIGLANYYYKQYSFKNYKLKTFFFISPILVTLIGTGTRFLLLFAIFVLFYDLLQKITFKRLLQLLFITLFIISVGSIIKNSRRGGIFEEGRISFDQGKYKGLTNYLASKGSVEGVIRNSAMIINYTRTNDYTYGKSFGFLFIFWIPRSVWPDKPVMLDSWLIQKYVSGLSEGYSSASGYGGELLMDFGNKAVNLILFLSGFFLKDLDNNIQRSSNNLKNNILGGSLFGWIFFATRSLLTATFILIGILIVLHFMFILLNKFKIILKIANE